MGNDVERRPVAQQGFYEALLQVETGSVGPNLGEWGDVLIWAQAVAESRDSWLESRDSAQGSDDEGVQHDEHVKAWLEWCATRKQAAE